MNFLPISYVARLYSQRNAQIGQWYFHERLVFTQQEFCLYSVTWILDGQLYKGPRIRLVLVLVAGTQKQHGKVLTPERTSPAKGSRAG
jgi:hypothetical protein